jgi:uncharacterized protein
MGIVLMILIFGVSALVSWQFKKKFKKYAQTPLSSGMTGKEIAEKMLRDSNIHDVKITLAQGVLSDHYNPLTKTVSLSKDVYYGRSVAAAAVSAHECGHALQDARQYSWLQLRSAMVPIVSYTNKVVPFVLLAGIMMIFLLGSSPNVLLAGIILFAATTLFSFVTLPVEYDASKRALVWLDSANVTMSREHDMARDALNAAAKTYVVAALSSMATLLYYVMIYMSARD